MMKHYYGWLLMPLLFLFASCRTDFLEGDRTGTQTKKASDRISFSEFQKETKVSKFRKTLRVVSDSKSFSSKNGELDISTFIVDSANINRFEMNGETTYAFSAFNMLDNSNKKYKMVYFYKEDKWNYSLLEINDDNTSTPRYDSRVGSLHVSNVSTSNNSICEEPYQTLDWACKNHESYTNCDKCGSCFVVSTHYINYCGPLGPGSGPGPGTGNDNGGTTDTGNNPGGGTPGNGITDPSPYYFDPFADATDPFQIRSTRANQFWGQLNYPKREWTNQKPDIYLNILEHYLDSYDKYYYIGQYQQNLDYHNWMVDIFVANPTLQWNTFYNQFLASPCDKITEQRQNTEFNNRMVDLQGKTNLKKETGYIQKNGGDYVYQENASATDQNNALALPHPSTNTYIKGYMHTHVNDFEDSDGQTRKGIKIFSPADMVYFMDMVKNAQDASRPLGDVYAVMVSGTVNYQIRFTGNQYQIKTFTDEQKAAFRESYTLLMEKKIDSQKQLELGFLYFISERMNLKGVSLYKMNTNSTNTEIKLNANKTDTVETNCPN